MTHQDQRAEAIAKHLADHERKIRQRRKAREAGDRRKKNRGLAAFLLRLKRIPMTPDELDQTNRR